MHVALTVSSLIYATLSIGKVLYASSIAKEREEHGLVREGVYHVYQVYVKDRKRGGGWGPMEKARARDLVVDYVHESRSRLCGCFSSPRSRLVSWIEDAVAAAKSRRAESLAVRMLCAVGDGYDPERYDGAPPTPLARARALELGEL